MTSRNLLQKICAWLHVLPLHQSHTSNDLPPNSLEQFLRAIWSAVFQAMVFSSVQFNRSIKSDSVTPWTAARQASLSNTNSRSWLKLTSMESVMPSNHLILCCPLLLQIKCNSGTFLVVRWLSLCAPNAGAQVRPLVRELDPTYCN